MANTALSFSDSLKTLLYAPLETAKVSELRRYAKGLITKPNSFKGEALRSELISLRGEVMEIIEERVDPLATSDHDTASRHAPSSLHTDPATD